VLELRYASQRLPQPVGPIGAVGGLMSAWLAQCIADAFGTDVLWYPGDYIGLAGAAMACGWDAPMGRGTRFAPRSPDRWSTRLTIYLELLARKRMEDS